MDEPEFDGFMPPRRPYFAKVVLKPTTAHLERMAYALKLFPEGAVVPVQVLQVLQDHWQAVLKASQPSYTVAAYNTMKG